MIAKNVRINSQGTGKPLRLGNRDAGYHPINQASRPVAKGSIILRRKFLFGGFGLIMVSRIFLICRQSDLEYSSHSRASDL